MRFAVLADTHFGVRDNGKIFHDSNQKFFEQVFFPTLRNRNINKIVHVGDVLHDRRRVDVNTINRAREYFFHPMDQAQITMDVICGNHDLYWKDKSIVDSVTEIFELRHNVTVYKDCYEYQDILYVPWINGSNRQQIMQAIDNSSCSYVFGHLHLIGYQMQRGHPATSGEDPNIFKKFKHVYSGHFHTKHTHNNVTYLGSVQQHTWADAFDQRGFHIFDTITGELEFIVNPFDMFAVIEYDPDLVIEPDMFSGKYVRIRVDQVANQQKLDNFVHSIEKQGAYNVQVINSTLNTVVEQVGSDVEVEDTLTLIRTMVHDNNVYDKLVELYTTANELR